LIENDFGVIGRMTTFASASEFLKMSEESTSALVRDERTRLLKELKQIVEQERQAILRQKDEAVNKGWMGIALEKDLELDGFTRFSSRVIAQLHPKI
jgi:hypothetical protein